MGDVTVRALREQLAAGQWQPAARALAHAADPETRAFLVGALTDVPGRPTWLDAWVAAAPADPDGYLVRGAQGVRWAWQARGHGDADTVSGTAFGTFWERLRVAERDLLHAAELAPDDPTPWSHLLTTARGLQLPSDDMWQRFQRARALAPHGYAAHAAMLQGTSAKWGGDSEETLRLARAASATAAPGSPLHSLVAEAHIEHCVHLAMEGQSAAAGQHWQRPDVAGDVREAALRSRRPSGPFAPRALTVLAYAASRTGDRDVAREQFAALGDLRVEGPYDYAANPTKLFSADRRQAGVR